MDDLRVSYVFAIKKAAAVLKKRFFFKGRLRFSEIIGLFSDNLWKFIPAKRVESVYSFLDRLVDKILCM